MASVGQLGEKIRQENHQYELWQELREKCLAPTLWSLESKIASRDKEFLEDFRSGLRIRFVSENPITLEVIRPEFSEEPEQDPSEEVCPAQNLFCLMWMHAPTVLAEESSISEKIEIGTWNGMLFWV